MYSDSITSFEELLAKDKTFAIHHQDIQSLAIEMYKATDPFLKIQNRACLWINSLKFYTVCFYCMAS